MTIDRRTFVAGLGAVVPASLTSSCARADESGWPGPDTPADQLPKLPIGMNLAGFADYETGFPFRNLMWGARPWMSRDSLGYGPWNTEQIEAFAFDADGYPLEVPLNTPGRKGIPQQVFTILPNTLSPGRYVVLYEGEGSFDGIHGTKIVSEQRGRVVINMAHDQVAGQPEGLIIRTSRRGNHVRNIRVVAIDDEATDLAKHPFRDDFLAFCRPFHALRFMDWLATNGSIEDEWSSRKKPTFYTMRASAGDADGYWGPKPSAFAKMFSGGIAHELVIQLANALEIDPWICLPHRASDDYIRKCAAFYRDRLDSRRRVYVEYSNEVWNWGFVQAQWMLRSEYAAKAVESRGLRAWEMRDGKLQGTAHPERIGALFSRAFRLWAEEWKGKDRERCTMVCAVMAGWAEVALRTMDWCYQDGQADAVAATGYFGPDKQAYAEWQARGAALTPDEVVSSMWRVLEHDAGKGGNLYRIAQRAQQYGLPYLCYEGGQHIQPEGQKKLPYMPALAAVQTHPEMYRLYVENLKLQRRLGVKLFCAFNSVGRQGTQFGSWGSQPSYGTPLHQSPKLRALLDCNT